MAGGEDRLASGRGPLLYGLIAMVVGVVGAIIFGLAVGGGTSTVAVTASPPTTAAGSAAPSAIASPLASGPSPVASSLASGAPPPTPTPGPSPTPNPTPKPTPRPTPNTNPRFVSLTIPKTEDCTGGTAGTIRISWTIANASGVTLAIDGPGIFEAYQGTSQAVDVPFACSHEQLSHTYTVTTTGGSGPPARITRTVTAAKAAIKSFALGQPNCPAQSGQVGISLTYEIVAATGVKLDRDGAVQFTNMSKKSGVNWTANYDCTKASQTFVLTTIGGFGPEATKQLVVRRSP